VQDCRNCLIIRYFLIAVLFIILVGLVFTDKTHYLSIIKPDDLAYLILFLGLLIFIVKLYQYLKKLSISNKSHKIGDSTRKSSKSMSRKKIN
jgi:disulfide bond formation protein DsbB